MAEYQKANNFVEIAKMYIGRPYRWGGDDAMAGFDCSGLVVECLQSVGMLKPNEDLTAHGLFQRCEASLTLTPAPGCLVIYFKDDRAYHIGIYWRDGLYITADGGSSKTLTLEDAIKQNAFIKIRPVDSRPDPQFFDIFSLRG